jgi:hypothetical protein
MDKETTKIVRDVKTLDDFVNSEGWRIAKTKLVAKVSELIDISNVKEDTAEKMVVDIKARKYASDILVTWLNEVESSNTERAFHDDLTLTDKSYIINS